MGNFNRNFSGPAMGNMGGGFNSGMGGFPTGPMGNQFGGGFNNRGGMMGGGMRGGGMRGGRGGMNGMMTGMPMGGMPMGGMAGMPMNMGQMGGGMPGMIHYVKRRGLKVNRVYRCWRIQRHATTLQSSFLSRQPSRRWRLAKSPWCQTATPGVKGLISIDSL